jgi:hypothetical protein
MALAVLLSVFLLLLAACAPGPNIARDTPDETGNIAGFWLGMWHGLICPITFLLSLFSDSVHLYEVHNNGGWYNFGFLIGASATLGGGTRASARRSAIKTERRSARELEE